MGKYTSVANKDEGNEMESQRRRYERSDVPKPHKYAALIGIVTLVVVATALGILVSWLWGMANKDAKLGNNDLSAALSTQSVEASVSEGDVLSSDDISCTLILTADKSLLQAQILALNTTRGTATLMGLPLEAVVENPATSEKTTLEKLYESDGAAGCVGPVAQAAGVKLAHVVVVGESFWSQLQQLSGSAGVDELSGLLSSVESDMGPTELYDMMRTAKGIGVANLEQVQASTTQTQLDDGSAAQELDAREVGVALGVVETSS